MFALSVVWSLAACSVAPQTPPVAPLPVDDAALVPTDALPVTVELADAPEVAPAPVRPTVPVVYELRRGESLDDFARWSGQPVEVLAESSGLDLSGEYPVGTKVVIPAELRERVDARRDPVAKERVERFLARRGGAVDTERVVVHTGDTATSIAARAGHLPVYVLEAYNPDVDLDHVRVGQALTVPVFAPPPPPAVADADASGPPE